MCMYTSIVEGYMEGGEKRRPMQIGDPDGILSF